jgi:hypothetical protein
MFGERCAGCSNVILGAFFTALNRKYHTECFVCVTCCKPFDGGQYALSPPGAPLDEQYAQCLTCYQQKHGRTCAACKNPVAFGEDTQHVFGRDYHLGCFTCSSCDCSLSGKQIVDDGESGLLLCVPCANVKKGNICGRCGNALAGKFMNAIGKKWHPECWTCVVCEMSLNGVKFSKTNADQPICFDCYKQVGPDYTRPDSSAVEASSAAHSSSAAVASSPWTVHTDSGSGHRYYKNAVTGESTWDKPADFDDEGDEREKKKAWEKKVDPSSGHAYYVSGDGVSTWDRPDDFVSEEDDSSSEEQEDKGGKWHAAVDPSTNRTYYWNSVTNEKSWTKPADFRPKP